MRYPIPDGGPVVHSARLRFEGESYTEALDRLARELIRRAFELSQGNLASAAQQLGLSATALEQEIARLGIDPASLRGVEQVLADIEALPREVLPPSGRIVHTTLGGDRIELELTPEEREFLELVHAAVAAPNITPGDLVTLVYSPRNPILDADMLPGRGMVTQATLAHPLYRVLQDMEARKRGRERAA